jgi:hypothetical protein
LALSDGIEEAMSLSSRFEHDLCRYLNDKVDSYSWKPQFHIGGPTREKVDVGGIPKQKGSNGGRPILVEVELRREDPVGNILKVWTRELKGGYPKGIILVQGFSRVYRTPKYSNHRIKGAVAIRFGRMIEESTKKNSYYVPIRIPYHPHAGSNEGNGARRDAALWFGKRIAARLRSVGVSLSEN